MKERKVPLRMCSGCGEMKPKQQLVRVVKGTDGSITVDLTGKKNGRGAYICHDVDCLKKARKSKRIDRSFSMQIPDDIYDRLEGEISREQ